MNDRHRLAPTDRTCPSCRIRHRIPPPSWVRDNFPAIEADESMIRLLQYAATFFDAESDDLFTARQFIEWLLPDLKGGQIVRDEMAGRREAA